MGNIALLLVGSEYPVNLGNCLRTAEAADVGPVYLYDSHSLFQTSKQRHIVSRVSRGALHHKGIIQIHDPYEFLRENAEGYRKIATVIDDSQAKVLFDFEFRPRDLLVFGEEDAGLDKGLTGLCDERVTIPRFCPSQCYSLVSAVSIFIGQYLNQLYHGGKLEPIEDYIYMPNKKKATH